MNRSNFFTGLARSVAAIPLLGLLAGPTQAGFQGEVVELEEMQTATLGIWMPEVIDMTEFNPNYAGLIGGVDIEGNIVKIFGELLESSYPYIQ